MYEDVLVPTDGSDTVDEALDHALHVADEGATVHALYVVDRRVTAATEGDERDDLEATLREEGEAAVAAVRERASEAGLEAATDVRAGTPSKAVLEYAGEAGVDIVVIGTRGKSPREKAVGMGSVSERVVDGADRPVLVVRGVGGE